MTEREAHQLRMRLKFMGYICEVQKGGPEPDEYIVVVTTKLYR